MNWCKFILFDVLFKLKLKEWHESLWPTLTLTFVFEVMSINNGCKILSSLISQSYHILYCHTSILQYTYAVIMVKQLCFIDKIWDFPFLYGGNKIFHLDFFPFEKYTCRTIFVLRGNKKCLRNINPPSLDGKLTRIAYTQWFIHSQRQPSHQERWLSSKWFIEYWADDADMTYSIMTLTLWPKKQ